MLDNTPTAKNATQAIKENPYTADIRNCTDAYDCQHAIDYLFACEKRYGQQAQIDAKISALVNRRDKFEEAKQEPVSVPVPAADIEIGTEVVAPYPEVAAWEGDGTPKNPLRTVPFYGCVEAFNKIGGETYAVIRSTAGRRIDIEAKYLKKPPNN